MNLIVDKGVDEIKSHPFFADVDWDNLYKQSRENIFIPKIEDKFDTGYFIRNGQGDSFVSGEIHPESKE